MKLASVRQTIQMLSLLGVAITVAFALSAYLHLKRVDEASEMALSSARSLFKTVATTRQWNASHGGGYVPVTEQFQPNPSLDDALRDVQTDEGLTLTKINPAYMTRLIAQRLG